MQISPIRPTAAPDDDQQEGSWTVPHSWRKIGGLVVLLVAVYSFAAVTEPRFLTGFNQLTVLRAASITGIVAVGMTFITLSGSFVSLSVQESAIFGSVLFALAVSWGWGIVVAIAIVFVSGALIGLAQGITVARGLNPIVVTLAAASVILGVVAWITGGRTIEVGSGAGGVAAAIGRGSLWGVPNQTVAFLSITVASVCYFRWTRLGRETLLAGDSRPAAEASGVRPGLAIAVAFIVSSLSASLVGVFNASQFGQGSNLQFAGLTIAAIAAVVVGGTSIKGGRGSPALSAAGAIGIAAVENYLLLRGAPFGLRALVLGLIIAVGVVAGQIARRHALYE